MSRVLYARGVVKDTPEPTESFDWLGMILMSPGLAFFLYGVSSIPGEGTAGSPKVLGFAGAGLLLMLAFVFHSFRPQHPLLDLRLFRNRNLTSALVTMFIFSGAFFGGLLLVPTYLQTVRGLGPSTRVCSRAQGLGAMITMPIAVRSPTSSPSAASCPSASRRSPRHVRPTRWTATPPLGLLIPLLCHGSRHGRDDDPS